MFRRAVTIAALLCVLPAAARAELALPVRGAITSGVGWRPDPFGSGKYFFHRGVDIAVPAGTPVEATRSGRVTFAGPDGGYGSTVIIRHENGDSTLYGHNSALAVSVGATVKEGQVIAYSGNSGRSTGPHVHYEVRSGGGPAVVMARAAEQREEKVTVLSDARDRQEMKMDEAMASIFSTIRENAPATKGGEGG